MSDNFDPFDPVGAAFSTLGLENAIKAKDARIKHLEKNRPRYSVYVGRKSVDAGIYESCYLFRDHAGEGETDASDTLVKGVSFLYRDKDFVSMKDPHDAIIFCRELNAAEEARNHG